jgi:hypothetical protein
MRSVASQSHFTASGRIAQRLAGNADDTETMSFVRLSFERATMASVSRHAMSVEGHAGFSATVGAKDSRILLAMTA